MNEAQRELPYEGAKEMLLVEDIEDREFLKSYLKQCIRNDLNKGKRDNQMPICWVDILFE